MSLYSIVLFLHVIGVIGYFIGIGIWLFVLAGLRRALRVEQVRALLNLIAFSGPFSGISALLLLAAGLYMAITAWSMQTSWILVALISLILIVPLTAVLVEPRRRALHRLVQGAPDGVLSEELRLRTHDPVLQIVLQTVAVLLLGLVFLMTTKPELAASLIAMVVALILGLGSGVLVSQAGRNTKPTLAVQQERGREPAS